jgi:hypothetical protein
MGGKVDVRVATFIPQPDTRRQYVFCFTVRLIISGKETLLRTGLKAEWARINLEAMVNRENLVPAENESL